MLTSFGCVWGNGPSLWNPRHPGCGACKKTGGSTVCPCWGAVLLSRTERVKSGNPDQEAMEGTLCASQNPWVLNGKMDHTVGPKAFESGAHLDKRCKG